MQKLHLVSDEFPTSTEISSHISYTWKLGFILLAIRFLQVVFSSKQFWTKVKSTKLQQKIPGPSSLPIIGILHHIVGPGKDPFKTVTNLCLKYGKIFKGKIFGLNFVVLNDPAYIKKVLTSTSPDHLNKPHQLYDALLDGNVTNGIFSSEYPVWKHHRKVIARPLAIHNQIGKVNLHLRKMVQSLRLNGDSDENSVFNTINGNALNMILDIIMDMELATDTELGQFHKSLLLNREISGRRIASPWLLLEYIWKFHPMRKQMLEASSHLKIFLDRIYKTCMIQTSPNETDLEAKMFSNMMTEMAASGFSNDDVFQEVLTLIAASYETSTWATSIMLICLALNPDHQEKCRREVDQLYQRKKEENSDRKISPGEVFDLTMADVNSLDYLDRCVKESLRLAPTVPVFARRLDSPLQLEDDLILKKGTIVAMTPWGAHRNPEFYPEPEKFDPDRFLPEEVSKRHPYAYFPFSGGMRNCVGSKLALFFIKLATIQILRNFVVVTTSSWESLKFIFEVSLAVENMNLGVRKREDLIE